MNEQEVRKKLLDFIAKATDDMVLAKVISAEESVCKVQLIENEDIILENIKTTASQENEKGFLLKPKTDSIVLVSKRENAIIMFSELETATLKIENTTLKIDATGFEIKKQNETLKKILADLVQVITQMTFTNSAGSTAVANNVASFTSITTRINDLLK
jgi:hypothetical protein